MRSGPALFLVLTLAAPPRMAHAGGWTAEQRATLEKMDALENAGDLAGAETLATHEFEQAMASPGFRRALAKRGRAVAEALFATTKDVSHLCTALTLMRVYQAELMTSERDRADIPAERERLEALAMATAAPCARPADPPPAPALADPPRAMPRQEGPEPPSPAPIPGWSPRRSRAQIGVGAGFLVATVGLAAGFGGCFAAREPEADRIRALDKRATDAGRDLTTAELADVHAADRRYARLSNTGKALGVLAGLSLVVGVVVLAMPPRVRSRARALGAGVHINF